MVWRFFLFPILSTQKWRTDEITWNLESEALRRYSDSMYAYVNAVCSHQEQREIALSTVEGYIARRTYTIGAYPCIMILE
jgi:hypothetical protein